MTGPEPIPLIIRTRLAHATLQAIADECGADILHIKGAAVDPSLLPQRQDAPPDATPQERARTRVSADADVLVRPAHLKRFLVGLRELGWQEKTKLHSRGAVEHSVDWWHPQLGSVDIHVRFPGIQLEPSKAFAHFWVAQGALDIAHRPCLVPNRDAQRFLLMINAARNGGAAAPDVVSAWAHATQGERDRVVAMAAALRAEVALASATGRLDDYANRPEYELWRLMALPNPDVFELWLAFVKAAPTAVDRARAIRYAWQVKVDRVEMGLGRPATAAEVFHSQRTRISRGGAGMLRLGKVASSIIGARVRTRSSGRAS